MTVSMSLIQREIIVCFLVHSFLLSFFSWYQSKAGSHGRCSSWTCNTRFLKLSSMVTSLQHMILVISFIISFYLLWTDAAVTRRASASAFFSSVGLPMASHEVQESMSPTALFQPILMNYSLVQIHREHLIIPVISADNTKICVDLPRSSSPCSALVSVPPTERTGMSPMEINRRKLNKLNIVKICEEILNLAVPMALRLSGILMGGVVIVYERKAKILYDDVQRLLVEVNEAWTVKSVTDRNVLPKGKSQAKYEAVTLPDHHEEMEISAGECAGFRSDINGFRYGEESMRTILLFRRFCKFAFQKRFCNLDPVGTTLHSAFAFQKGLCICIQRCGSCSLYTREHLVPGMCDCLRQFTFRTTKIFASGLQGFVASLLHSCCLFGDRITRFLFNNESIFAKRLSIFALIFAWIATTTAMASKVSWFSMPSMVVQVLWIEDSQFSLHHIALTLFHGIQRVLFFHCSVVDVSRTVQPQKHASFRSQQHRHGPEHRHVLEDDAAFSDLESCTCLCFRSEELYMHRLTCSQAEPEPRLYMPRFTFFVLVPEILLTVETW